MTLVEPAASDIDEVPMWHLARDLEDLSIMSYNINYIRVSSGYYSRR
jgi:hypothetical protein